MKQSIKLRYKNSWMDYKGDGRYPKERIKGKDKRYLRKWSLRKLLRAMDREQHQKGGKADDNNQNPNESNT